MTESTPGPLHRNPGSRHGGPLLIAAAAIGITLLTGAVFVGARLWLDEPAPTLPPRESELASEKYERASEAFGPGYAPVGGEEADGVEASTGDGLAPKAELEACLEALRTAVLDRDADAFAASLDVERMAAEIARLGLRSPLSATEQVQFEAGLRSGLMSKVADGDVQLLDWSEFEIRSVEPVSDSADEVVLFVRAWDADRTSMKFRIWLRREGARWRFYDLEDLDGGFRISTAMAVGAAAKDDGEWTRYLAEIQAATGLLMDGDFAGAEARLRELEGADGPELFEAIRWMLLSSALIGQGEYAEAERAIDRSESLNPEAPAHDYQRAVIYNGLGRHEEAIEAAERYGALLGADADSRLELGLALLGLGRDEEAAGAFRLGLEDDPQAAGLIPALARALPDEGEAELADHFARLADPLAAFEGLALDLLASGEHHALELLVAKARELDPTDANPDYYQARSWMDQGRDAEAVVLLRGALERAPADELDDYRALLSEALLWSGEPLAAYDLAPEDRAARRNAFWDLGLQLLTELDDPEATLDLVELHRAADPEDPWTVWFEVEALVELELFDDADECLAEALEAIDDEEVAEALEGARVEVWYGQGRIAQAYATLGERHETAHRIAEKAWSRDDAAGLAEILGLHAAVEPEDPELGLWRAWLAWLREDWEGTLAAIAKGVKTVAGLREQPWLWEDLEIRSLLRLGRVDEALVAARASTERDGDPWFEAIALAVAGDVPASERAFLRCLELDYAPDTFYGDPDAGPAFASEAFAKLRARHPAWYAFDESAD